MSEEEIIKYIKTIKPKNFNNYKDETPCSLITKKQIKAIQGLLDLYNKEKEKNKCIEKIFVVDDLPEGVNVCFINSDFFSNYKEIANFENRIKLIDIIQKLLDILKEGE